jgi:hypothetical protein
MLAFGQRQRWRRRRNLLQSRRIARDLNDRPYGLAILSAMVVLDVGKLWMNESAASRPQRCDHAQLCE